MRLGKPPIIEAWVGFHFEPLSNSSDPFPNSAAALLRNRATEYPVTEYQFDQQVMWKTGSPSELPKAMDFKTEISRVRSFNVARTRCIQVMKERLVYSAIKTSEPYPGYEALRDEALGLLDEYISQITPSHVRETALFYKDIIEISATDKRIENLRDYFRDIPEMQPQIFGDTVYFSFQHMFACPTDKGPLIQSLKPLPNDPAIDSVRFEMTWLKACEGVNSLDRENIKGRLDAAHDYLSSCFRASLTDATWQLFEPQG